MTSTATFWVIETARQTYWDGRQADEAAFFSDKIDDAAKFWDFASAEIVRCWLLEKTGAPRLRSVEHKYLSGVAKAS